MSRPHVLALTADRLAALARERFVAERGEAKGSGIASELYAAYFRQGLWSVAGQGLGAASLGLWESLVETKPPLALVRVEHEEAAAKALFRLEDGALVETVLVPMAEGQRFTLCVSSQAGCAMGCAFCQTGYGGLGRSLATAEIVGQVHAARFALGWDFSGLVFMGMGEPLDNRDAVFEALDVLTDRRGFAFAQERLTLCTVGLVDGIEALARRGLKRLGLSLSLNAARQDLRERLMPAARSNPLPALQAALAAYPQRRNFVLALNWCLLPGLNDTEADADECAAFAAGLGRTLVNVIPYNPGTPPLAAAPTEAEVDRFVALLRARGLDARVRGPKGRSIQAACGQLGAALP